MTNLTGPEPLVIRTPEDAIAAVPYLLGFHPEKSLVVVAHGGPYGCVALRVDLLAEPVSVVSVAVRVADMLTGNGFERAYLVGYGTDAAVTPLVRAVERVLRERRFSLEAALRVSDGRWWTYGCHDPSCCPQDGTPFDIGTTVIAAQATVAGHVAFRDRATLAATVAPVPAPIRTAMRQATRHAETRLQSLTEPPATPRPLTPHPHPHDAPHDAAYPPSGDLDGALDVRADGEPNGLLNVRADGEPNCLLDGRADGEPNGLLDVRADGEPNGLLNGRADGDLDGAADDDELDDELEGWETDPRVLEGLPFVRRVIEALPRIPGYEDIAWLGVLLTHMRVRDEAWVRITPDRLQDHITLWREVLRHAEPAYVPAPACLLAYAAFLSGDGGLANVALDRAQSADPTYSMAALLRQMAHSGIPPAKARLRMTPEDLAAAWNATRRQGP